MQSWFETGVMKFFAQLVIKDVYGLLHEKDQDYFRTSREERFGKTLEELCPDPEAAKQGLAQALTPMRQILKGQPYLGGDEPSYMDYVPFGAFMWARCVSDVQLLAEDDPVEAWRRRLLDAHGGAARQAPCKEAA